MNYKYLFYIAVLLLFTACNKEEPKLTISINPSTTTVNSGEPIDFEIIGDAEFLVFYSGLPGQEYVDYPNASSEVINMLAEEPEFAYTYRFNGVVTATFVATSTGNWAEDKDQQIIEFDIEVIDNNTNLRVVNLRTSGLFGQEFESIIDREAGIVMVQVPTGTNVSKLTTNIVTSSTRSTILLDGQPFQNNSSVDFTSESRTFTVNAIGGASRDWKVVIEFI